MCQSRNHKQTRERKRKILIDEIANIKRSKATLKACINSLHKDGDALSFDVKINKNLVK